jgi:hypothetical protein
MSEPMTTLLEAWQSPTYDAYAEPVGGVYSEAAWLRRLGPSSWLIWGVLARNLAATRGPVVVDLAEIAAGIGIGGPNPARPGSTLHRSLQRLRVNRLVRPAPHTGRRLLVRIYAPAVSWRAFHDLPDHVKRLHVATFQTIPALPAGDAL